MDKLLIGIGKRIRTAREALGLSQEEVAARAQLNTSYLSQIERGRKSPSLEVLVRITGAVNLSLPEVFADQEVTTTALGEREVARLLEHVPEERRADLLGIIRAAAGLARP